MSEMDTLSQLEQLAMFLADADSTMRDKLVEMRKNAGLTQTEIGRRMGISQESVAAFERYDNDPKLSTIRRYALAVGARVAHSVESDKGERIRHEETLTATVVVTGLSIASSSSDSVLRPKLANLVLTVSN